MHDICCSVKYITLMQYLIYPSLDTQALNAMQYIPSSVINIRHCKKLTLFLAIKRNRIILNNSQGKIKLKKYNLFVTVMLKIQNKNQFKALWASLIRIVFCCKNLLRWFPHKSLTNIKDKNKPFDFIRWCFSSRERIASSCAGRPLSWFVQSWYLNGCSNYKMTIFSF